MPNWVHNAVTISHEDPEMIARAERAFNEGKFLEEFIPNKGDPDDWYNHNIANWGTKWDVGGDDAYCERDGNTLQLGFDSAWSPPTAAYTVLEELGFTVKATYWEPGMAFCGIYEDGDDDYYEYGNMSADEIEDFLPAELLDLGIADDVRSWQDEQDELREDDEGDE